MKRRFKEFVSVYFIASILYGLFALLLVYPFHPISTIGWTIWFVAALPVAMIGEAAGSIFFDRNIGKAISDDTERVSTGRIAYGVIAALMLLTISLFLVWLLEIGWGDFWDAHFSTSW